MIIKKGKIKIDFFNLNREMEGILNRMMRRRSLLEADELTEWRPYIDIYEMESEYCILMELAGIEKDDVEISCEDVMLKISGKRREFLPSVSKKPHHLEIDYGSFERVISLPENADTNKAKAAYESGMLIIKFPKRKPVITEAVQVKVK